MSATPAPPQSFLMDIPLELRYKVFEAVALRSNPPEHLFVHWFEKQEIAELTRNHVADNPDGPPPIAKYSKYRPEPELESDSEGENEDGDEDEAEDSDMDGEDDGQDEDMDDEDDGVDQDEAEPEDEDMGDDNEEQVDEGDAHMASTDADVQQETQTQVLTANHAGQENALQPNSEIEEPANVVEAVEVVEAAVEEQEPEAIDDVGHGDAAIDGENLAQAVADATDATDAANAVDADIDATTIQPALPSQPAPPPPRPTVLRPHPKWRHVAKFMKITHYPPPMELLLSSKALNHESMDWYYDAAILHIQATSGSLAHTSFFEEALNQIADAAFSPVENIRKVEVTFVWDSAWIQAQEDHEVLETILPALLHERARFILGILKRAPALKELVIHWHDSLQDNNSTDMKLEILESFLELPANVNVVENFIEPDAKPYKKSIAGKFRMELQGIANRGLGAFYG